MAMPCLADKVVVNDAAHCEEQQNGTYRASRDDQDGLSISYGQKK